MDNNKNIPLDDANDTNLEELLKIEKNIHRLKWCELISTGILLLIIFISLMVVVIIQLNTKNLEYEKAATIINTYTSIVLGFVAMTVSLIGMVLSFHNTIQTENNNLMMTKEFSNLSHSINQLNELEIRLENHLSIISTKTTDLEQEMKQFESLKEQMEGIQIKINQISNDIQISIDQSKGNIEGVKNINPIPQKSTSIDSDENEN